MAASKIIDVSKWQGAIDWHAAKSEVALAIIRVQDGTSYLDSKADDNIRGCKANNIPYGVYAFFRAKTAGAAVTEMNTFLERTKAAGGGARFYVLDCETDSVNKASIRAAVNTLLKAGVRVGIYFANHLYPLYGGDYGQHFTWIPRYGSRPKYRCDLWQYTSSGSVMGIRGNVDLNMLTLDDREKTLEWFVGKPALEGDVVLDCAWVTISASPVNLKTAKTIADQRVLHFEYLAPDVARIHVRKTRAESLITVLQGYTAFKGKMRVDETFTHSWKNPVIR